MRTTFGQIRTSRIPQALGLCATDTARLQSYVNEAQQRLLMAGGERGWWGTWYRIALTATNGYVTLPRNVARLIDVAVCQDPIIIQNEWYEFLYAGAGLQPPSICTGCNENCGPTQGYDRNTVVTAVDITAGMLVRAYPDDANDAGKKLLIQATDANDVKIRELYGTNMVEGFYLTLASPFVTSTFTVNSLYGIEKDETLGNVLLYQVDPTTGDETLLATYEPSEYRPSYRRYYIGHIPDNCCSSNFPVTITAMASLEFIPVTLDTDWLIIGNIPALKEECESIRYAEQDNPTSQQMSILKHRNAIKLLNQELDHYMGREMPAINFKPFGKARLEDRSIGTLV